jgi:osmotically inducible protein OsmC
MSRTAKVVYTARTATIGGREDGASRSADGLLDIRLSTPGSVRIGSNPEQLFAAGWSASFASAIASIAYQRKIALPAKVRIDAEVNLNCGENGCFLSAQLDIAVPGLKRGVIQALVADAHEICPYSKATQGNIDVTTRIV